MKQVTTFLSVLLIGFNSAMAQEKEEKKSETKKVEIEIKSDVSDDSDGVNLVIVDFKKYPCNRIVGYAAFGMMTLNSGPNDNLNKHQGFSNGIDLGLLYRRQFTKTSPLEFFTGAYLAWKTLRFDDDRMISRDINGQVDLVQHTQHLDKSKLRGTYIMVPLGVKYSFAKLKTRSNGDQYRNIDRGIGLSANVFGGFNIKNKNIVESQDLSFKNKSTNYNLNPVAYGGQVTLSIFSWNFFVRQEFNSYFKSNTFDNRGMTEFGINLGF